MDFFEAKSHEETPSKKATAIADMDKRLQAYDKRPKLETGVQVRGMLKRVPKNEAETLLVADGLPVLGARVAKG